MRNRFVLTLPVMALAVAACDPAATGAVSTGASAIGGAGASAAAKVSLAKSGADSCGAADFAFLTGQPYAHTFDIALPSGTRFYGRREKPDALNNPSRLNINVSTRRAFHAETDGKAKITKVYCG